ncbi:MAG: GH3 auxin-responsive promoter family protein [Anaerolineae bacterium]|nr:GH3 auxin-responsive promoter family protein [Anaerolineae bacterium]
MASNHTYELLKQGRKSEIWTRYCGYFDLSVEEFQKIQERLLLEQIDLLYDSEIGRHFMGPEKPKTVAEFRAKVPLTKYEDYVPFLAERKTDALPVGEYFWARTSGRSGGDMVKWVPYSRGMYDRHGEAVIGGMIISAAKYKGDVQIEPGDVLLLASAPPPYSTGLLSHSLAERAEIRFVPSIEEGEQMEFVERIAAGFDQALDVGLDYFFGVASVLAKMGERFENRDSSKGEKRKMPSFRAILRLVKGAIKARSQKRSLLPKDLWKLKGIMAGGTDTVVYRELLEHYWGQKPLEGYSCTEGLTFTTHAWNRKDMTFYPDMGFMEFIPYDEYKKWKDDPSYTPKTVLHHELTPGIYEIVFTNYHGGVLMRYRVGDLLQITSMRDDELNINLPQAQFYARADDMINVGGLATFTETHLWEVIADSGVPFEDWAACKEVIDGDQVLHLYVELRPESELNDEALKIKLRGSLEKLNHEFIDMENIIGKDCLAVTRLPNGAFTRYMQVQRAAGADLGHTKPPHMQPNENILRRLMQP